MYQERGTRSQAERGVAWNRPGGEAVSSEFHRMGKKVREGKLRL